MNILKIVEYEPHLENFNKVLIKLKYLNKLENLNDIESFIFDIYEPTLEIIGNSSVKFNLNE